MIGREGERCGEGDVELDLLTRYRPIAACRHAWQWMDAAGLYRIKSGDAVGQNLGTEGKIA